MKKGTILLLCHFFSSSKPYVTWFLLLLLVYGSYKKSHKKITSPWFCRFDKSIALELGAGLGLCSIVLGRVAKKVFCTGMLKNTSKFKYLPWERVPALEITSVFTTEHACSLKCPHLLKSSCNDYLPQFQVKNLLAEFSMAWGTCDMIEIINKSFMLVYFICLLF